VQGLCLRNDITIGFRHLFLLQHILSPRWNHHFDTKRVEPVGSSTIANFMRRWANPQVQIELVTGTTGAPLEQVSRYAIEAAFVAERFESDGLEMMSAFRSGVCWLFVSIFIFISFLQYYSPRRIRQKSE
jgi:hypothetical protein